MYNYKLPLETIREMMEDLDNSGLTRKKKKLEYLVFQLSKQKVILEKESWRAWKNAANSWKYSPPPWKKIHGCSCRCFSTPSYILQRKRIYKNVSKVQQKLCEILNGKV